MAGNSNVLKQAFHEVFTKTPRNVLKTKKKGRAKRKMLIAIALSKARRAGYKG